MYTLHRLGWRFIALPLVISLFLISFALHQDYLTLPSVLDRTAATSPSSGNPYGIVVPENDPSVVIDYDEKNATDALPGFCDACGPGDKLCAKYGEAFLARSRAFDGAGTRVRRTLLKALAGRPVTIAVLGGSVTVGRAVEPNEKWTELLFDWWESQFPDSDLTMHNAGVPGTGTTYFSMCFQEHIPLDPDLVITEFAINDLGRDDEMASFEWVLRRALDLEKSPAVINLQVFGLEYPRLATGGDYHTSVANYYDTPVISLRNAVLPGILANPSSAPTYFGINKQGTPDYKHINARMHRALTDMLIHYLQAQICSLVRHPSSDLRAEPVPPFGLQSKFGVNAARVPAIRPTCASLRNARTELVAVSSDKWDKEATPAGWFYVAKTPGARASFRTVSGVLGQIRVTFMRSTQFGLGVARCWIDDKEAAAVLVDGFWWRHVSVIESYTIASNASPGEHTVSCELTEQTNDPLKRTNFWIVGVDAA
ncbi:SGNH hydrolase [Auricularia subglabra TFB-10046 SS5]|nr:SGNH hydrolase [Auricularia subglabra TFB-10046 SS5]